MTRRSGPFDEMAGGIIAMFAIGILIAFWAAIGVPVVAAILKFIGWVKP